MFWLDSSAATSTIFPAHTASTVPAVGPTVCAFRVAIFTIAVLVTPIVCMSRINGHNLAIAILTTAIIPRGMLALIFTDRAFIRAIKCVLSYRIQTVTSAAFMVFVILVRYFIYVLRTRHTTGRAFILKNP